MLTPVALDHLRENLKRKAEHLSSPMSAKRSRKSSSDEAIDLSFKTTDSNSETSVEEIPNAPLQISQPKDASHLKGKIQINSNILDFIMKFSILSKKLFKIREVNKYIYRVTFSSRKLEAKRLASSYSSA